MRMGCRVCNIAKSVINELKIPQHSDKKVTWRSRKKFRNSKGQRNFKGWDVLCWTLMYFRLKVFPSVYSINHSIFWWLLTSNRKKNPLTAKWTPASTISTIPKSQIPPLSSLSTVDTIISLSVEKMQYVIIHLAICCDGFNLSLDTEMIFTMARVYINTHTKLVQ